MANRNDGATPQEKLQALDAVTSWLEAEDEFQFSKHGKVDIANAATRIVTIREIELDRRWRTFRHHRQRAALERGYDSRSQKLANKNILEASAEARTMFVLKGLTQGVEKEVAQRASWAVYSRFTDSVRTLPQLLPTVKLLEEESVVDAVNQFVGHEMAYNRIDRIFTSLSGLAITALAEQSHKNGGELIIPLNGPISRASSQY